MRTSRSTTTAAAAAAAAASRRCVRAWRHCHRPPSLPSSLIRFISMPDRAPPPFSLSLAIGHNRRGSDESFFFLLATLWPICLFFSFQFALVAISNGLGSLSDFYSSLTCRLLFWFLVCLVCFFFSGILCIMARAVLHK